ncbi:MAG: hypothetical protein M5T61_21340 [Acidimicrobiia bacterium]|nr:hypothetical protein [Acidimicrobiia bacterium]
MPPSVDGHPFQVNHHTGVAETLAAGPEYGVQWLLDERGALTVGLDDTPDLG